MCNARAACARRSESARQRLCSAVTLLQKKRDDLLAAMATVEARVIDFKKRAHQNEYAVCATNPKIRCEERIMRFQRATNFGRMQICTGDIMAIVGARLREVAQSPGCPESLHVLACRLKLVCREFRDIWPEAARQPGRCIRIDLFACLARSWESADLKRGRISAFIEAVFAPVLKTMPQDSERVRFPLTRDVCDLPTCSSIKAALQQFRGLCSAEVDGLALRAFLVTRALFCIAAGRPFVIEPGIDTFSPWQRGMRTRPGHIVVRGGADGWLKSWTLFKASLQRYNAHSENYLSLLRAIGASPSRSASPRARVGTLLKAALQRADAEWNELVREWNAELLSRMWKKHKKS